MLAERYEIIEELGRCGMGMVYRAEDRKVKEDIALKLIKPAHKLGIIHHDLKSNNIMIDRDGNARIMDFGIARTLKGRSITGAGVMIGSPECMSLEQAEGKDVDESSDLKSQKTLVFYPWKKHMIHVMTGWPR